MTRSTRLLAPALLFFVLVSTATALFTTYPNGPQIPALLSPSPIPSAVTPHVIETPIVEPLPILPGDTLQAVIRRGQFEPPVESALVNAIVGAVDPRNLRAGTAFHISRTALLEPKALEYQVSTDQVLKIAIPPLAESAGAFEPLKTHLETIPSTLTAVPICATMQSSLFESIAAAGERPELALRMAEIFAWDLDFYTDPQNGDDFCLLVEKRTYENGQSPSYGTIHAATYNNMGTVHDAFLFPDKGGKPVYYSSDGTSTQAAFLRSPLKFAARISSRFSHSRLHPVLKIRRPHLGIDYAAPTGTPVQAVAAGTVTFSGRSGGAGNLIKLRHTNGFETYYMHLSRRQVRQGQKIEQGQQIGLVGSTGLSTGPHLDFRIRKNGRYLNFERLDLPRQSSVEAARLPAFNQKRNEFMASFDAHPHRHESMLAAGKTTPGSRP